MAAAKDAIKEMLLSEGAKYQMLSSCVEDAQRRKGVTVIKFATKCADIMDVIENRGMVGIVLWIPRADFDAAQSK